MTIASLTAAAMLGGAPVAAAPYVATFTGVTLTGVDYTRYFGGAEIRDPVTVSVTITYDLAGAVPVTIANGFQLFGGSDYGGASVIQSVRLFNAAGSLQFVPGVMQVVTQTNTGSPPAGQLGFATDNIVNIPGTVFLQTRDSLTLRAAVAGPVRLAQAGSYAISSYGGSLFSIDYPIVDGAQQPYDRFLTAAIGGAGTLTIAEAGGAAGGVPEPATWASMILGLGAIGAVRRRRLSARLTPDKCLT